MEELITLSFERLVPTYLSPAEFWGLSFTELDLVTKNIQQENWNRQYERLSAGRVLASDISRVLAGEQFKELTSYLPPSPDSMKVRSDEEIERTLLLWAQED